MLGVPVESAALKGMDSLLSIVQMPAGIPVGTLAIGRAGAINAALLAASIVGLGDAKICARRWRDWRARQTEAVADARPRTTPRPLTARHERSTTIIPPGSTIGILGGGQLGRMTALAAARLGYRCIVYAPEAIRSRARSRPAMSSGAYDDEAALARFAAQVDVITYEFENVPEATVAACERHKPVRPGVQADPCRPAPAAREGVLPQARHRHRRLPADPSEADIAAATALPGILKTCTEGYDGKGQVARRRRAAELAAAWAEARPARLHPRSAGRFPVRDLGRSWRAAWTARRAASRSA